MSLGVVIKGPEGVVLAADSRVSLEAHVVGIANPLFINYDNASKLLTFGKPHNSVAAVTYGVAVIGQRTAHSFLPELENVLETKHPKEAATVDEYANIIRDFYTDRWNDVMPQDYQGPDMTFIVGGFDPGAAYGKVYVIGIPHNPGPTPRNVGDDEFGMTWGGQLQIATRLIHGYDPALPALLKQHLSIDDQAWATLQPELAKAVELGVPYNVLPLQDCVKLAIFLIRTTITAQSLAVALRGVGGFIDVATITRTEGLRYVQRKRVRGEFGSVSEEPPGEDDDNDAPNG